MGVTEQRGRSQQRGGRQQNTPAPTEAQSRAVELARQGPGRLLATYVPEFASIAPKHVDAEAFVALAAAYIRRDEYLSKALVQDPASLILALRECATLGHVVRKGEFALTAFYNKKVGGYSAVGIEEWRGVVQRMFRSGGVRAVHVGVGREHDEVLSFQQGADILPRHKYNEFASKAERGALKAVWAWADLMHGGPSEVAWLNRHDVERLRSMSKTATYVREGESEATGGNFWGPAWPGEGPNTEAMWRKTALHQLEGMVPTSAAYRFEVAAAGAAIARTPAGIVPDVDPGVQRTDWIDADEEPPAGTIPPGTAADANVWPNTATPGGA